MKNITRLIVVVGLLLACKAPAAEPGGTPPANRAGATGEPTAEEVLRVSGSNARLIVHLGVSDGQLELDLAKGGRRLVHGLAADDKSLTEARRRLTAAGVYGLASVELWHPQPKLPYAADLVNVLVADWALLTQRKIDTAEVMRILVPGGVAYLKEGGAWKATTRPWPKEMDDWTHFHYDCTGNPVSHDTQAGPVTTLKWIDGYRGGGGLRSWMWRGAIIHEMPAGKGGRTGAEALHLAARDGFNGLPHYFLPYKSGAAGTVVADGKIFTMANLQDPLGPMRAYDLATGNEVLRFDEGGKPESAREAGWAQIAYHEGRVFQTAKDSLYALDAKTGKRQWVYREPDGNRLLWVSVAADLDRVFVAVTRKDEIPLGPRWPGSRAVAIVGLDGQTGKQVWRNDEVADQGIGQLVYADGRLAYFTPSGILAAARYLVEGKIGREIASAEVKAWIGALDARTGKLKWCRDYLNNPVPFFEGFRFAGFQFNIALRDGKLYMADQNGVIEFNADTGEPLKFLALPVNNGRCTRPRLTTKYHLIGFGSFVADDLLTSVNQNVSRGGCTAGMTPANGMIFLPPGNSAAHCRCFAMLRGRAGYGTEPPWEPLPVAQRVRPNEKAAPEAILDRVRHVEPAATINFHGKGSVAGGEIIRLPRFDGELVRNAWFGNDVLPYPETEPVKAGDLELVAVVHEHRLEARRGDRVVWSFVADGRISTAPVVHEGRVCVGAHDGWVSCLDLKDGRVQWRFLAAPNHRKIVAYGQLESSWPVYGAVVHEGLFAVSAGRHPELDGGIYFHGLEPATGRVRWSKRLHVAAEAVVGSRPDNKPRKWLKPANTIINGPLSVSDGKLALVSSDATCEGIARPSENYRVEIDPRAEGPLALPAKPNSPKPPVQKRTMEDNLKEK